MFEILDRILHGGDQSTFGEAGWRFGLAFCDRQCGDRKCLAFLHIRQGNLGECGLFFVLVFAVSIARLINFSPAGRFDKIAFRAKAFFADGAADGSLFILAGRRENRQKPAHDQIVNFALFIAHVVKLHKLFRRDDCMVIRHFAVIDKGFICLKFLHGKPSGNLAVRTYCAGF